jgi:hypothetical protein
MSISQHARCLRRWLLGLFVVAQVVGIVPLIYDHTLNVFETVPVAGHIHVHLANNGAAPDADHHHGRLDLHDQCCALHTLAGPLPCVFDVAPGYLTGECIVAAVANVLADSERDRLDRPPKSSPLI